MRFNRYLEIATDDRGAAVCGWYTDVTVGPYQRDIGQRVSAAVQSGLSIDDVATAFSISVQQVNVAVSTGELWQMVTRTNGVVSPVAGVTGGCNAVASSGLQWMRRLDGANPALGPGWLPADGRVGDIDGDLAITLDSEMVVAYVYDRGDLVNTFARTTPFGGLRLKGDIASWVAFPGPAVQAVQVRTGATIPIASTGQPQYAPVVFRANGDVWVISQTDAFGGIVYRASDASRGYRFGTPMRVYAPDVVVVGSGCVVGWSVDEG